MVKKTCWAVNSVCGKPKSSGCEIFQIFLDQKTEYLQGLSSFLPPAVINNFERRVPSPKKCAIVAGSALKSASKKYLIRQGKPQGLTGL